MLLPERKDPAGSVSGLCGLVPACREFHVSTVTKHSLVAFIREIQITSELGKCTAVRWRENTVFRIKLCCLCQCRGSGVVRECLYHLLGCLCSKSSCLHAKVNWVRGADSQECSSTEAFEVSKCSASLQQKSLLKSTGMVCETRELFL